MLRLFKSSRKKPLTPQERAEIERKLRPQAGDTVVIHGVLADYYGEFLSEYEPTQRSEVYYYDNVRGVWFVGKVDTARVEVMLPGGALNGEFYPQETQ